MKNWIFILALFFSCGNDEPMDTPATPHPHPSAEDADINLLFLGNSLTYSNDLPEIICELALMDNVKIAFTSITKPNYSLEDHWNEGDAQQSIRSSHYDFVIAQQGPSALPESQALLLDYTQKYADVCKEAGSQFALYMVWPSKSRSFDHDNVIFSYHQAAEKTESLLCPAGLAWKYAWQNDPDLPLYSFDFFHPSVMGSVLAGLTIYGAITGEHDFSFVKYEEASWRSEISHSDYLKLAEAATRSLQE